MTRSRAAEIESRMKRAPQPAAPLTFADDVMASLAAIVEQRIVFPSPVYQKDPVRFARDILGLEPWSRQVDLLEAVRDHDRVACKSGHRVSKSNSAAIIALWWFCSFPDARAILSSVTDRQVNQVLWREIGMRTARAGTCVACRLRDPDGHEPVPCPHSSKIDGKPGKLARSGLRSPDFREIVGFTARDAEAITGIAGKRLLFIFDEASGIPQHIFEGLHGNRAGGGKLLLLGNPTRNEGEFYDAFKINAKKDQGDPKSRGYKCLTISSEESPNVVAGEVVIEGLATREWIEERAAEWGEDSPLYQIRVKGEFAESEQGKIFSAHVITQAQAAWEDAEGDGRLFLGVDPAGATGTGDDTCFVLRRGCKVLEIRTRRALSDKAHVTEALAMLERHRAPGEVPVVIVDKSGDVGSKVFVAFRRHVERRKQDALVFGLRASDAAVRNPRGYDRIRDELTANLEAWFREGGAIPDDAHLAGELHAMSWSQMPNGKLKVTAKDRLRKELGRSPDRYDALALACWVPASVRDAEELAAAASHGAPPPSRPAPSAIETTRRMDPYAPRIDPYGGMRRR